MTATVTISPAQDAGLSLASHRLLPLEGDDVAMLADRSTGWAVVSRAEYDALAAHLGGHPSLADEDEGARAVLLRLWEAGLLLAGGRPHPDSVATPKPFPNALLLKLTGACNLDCTYCYDYDRQRFKARLDLERIQATIRSLARRQPSLALVFHGGEPLLRFELMRQIVEFAEGLADECAIGFSVQTNATRFSDEVVQFLDEHRFSVGISLDGHTAEANRMRVVRKGPTALDHVNALYERHPNFVSERCGFIAVASRTSAPGLPDFALWLQERGVGGLAISFLDLVGKGVDLVHERLEPSEAVDLFRRLVDLVRSGAVSDLTLTSLTGRINNLFTFNSRDLCNRGPCGASDDFLVLDAEGTQRTCDCIYDPFFEIGTGEVAAREETPARVAVVERHGWLRENGPSCSTCPLFGLCGGTCVAKAIARHGTPLSVDPIECALSQYLYPELLREFASGGETPLLDYYARHRGSMPGALASVS